MDNEQMLRAIQAGTLKHGDAFAEFHRRRSHFIVNTQLPDDLRTRGKDIFDDAITKLIEAMNESTPIVTVLRNAMLAIGELYWENDSRFREPAMPSMITTAVVTRRRDHGAFEQPASSGTFTFVPFMLSATMEQTAKLKSANQGNQSVMSSTGTPVIAVRETNWDGLEQSPMPNVSILAGTKDQTSTPILMDKNTLKQSCMPSRSPAEGETDQPQRPEPVSRDQAQYPDSSSTVDLSVAMEHKAKSGSLNKGKQPATPSASTSPGTPEQTPKPTPIDKGQTNQQATAINRRNIRAWPVPVKPKPESNNKYGNFGSTKRPQPLEATAHNDPGIDSALLSEAGREAEAANKAKTADGGNAANATDSGSDYDSKGPKRKRVVKQERIDAAIKQGRDRRRHTPTVIGIPEGNPSHRLYDVNENDSAVEQSVAASGREESISVQPPARRQYIRAKNRYSLVVRFRIPKARLSAFQSPTTSQYATASKSAMTSQPNNASTSTSATAPPPPTTAPTSPLLCNPAPRQKTPPEITTRLPLSESSSGDDQVSCTTPTDQLSPSLYSGLMAAMMVDIAHTCARGQQEEQKQKHKHKHKQDGDQDQDQDHDHDHDQGQGQEMETEMKIELEQQQQEEAQDQAEDKQAHQHVHPSPPSNTLSPSPPPPSLQSLSFPPFPPHLTCHTLSAFCRGITIALENILDDAIASPFLSLAQIIQSLEDAEPMVTEAESKVVLEGAEWVYGGMKEVCAEGGGGGGQGREGWIKGVVRVCWRWVEREREREREKVEGTE